MFLYWVMKFVIGQMWTEFSFFSSILPTRIYRLSISFCHIILPCLLKCFLAYLNVVPVLILSWLFLTSKLVCFKMIFISVNTAALYYHVGQLEKLYWLTLWSALMPCVKTSYRSIILSIFENVRCAYLLFQSLQFICWSCSWFF